ncbi:MAG: hypothetical protein RLO80_00970 [Hyphomonas sp.]
MASSDPPKAKRARRKGDFPIDLSPENPEAPANDAGASVFGVHLDAEALERCAKLSYWTALEAAYFSAGYKPGCETLEIPFIGIETGWLDDPLLYRQTLFERHLLGCDRGGHITPLEALQLLDLVGEKVDPQMRQAVQRFHSAKRRKKSNQTEARLGDFMDALDDWHFNARDEPEAATKRILTLLKLLLAMAIDKYGYVPNRYANPSSGRIVQAVEKIRLKCDDGTVSGYLKMAVEEHWTEPE